MSRHTDFTVTRKHRTLISLVLGMPSYVILSLIRNYPFEQMTLYAFLQYGTTASVAFFVLFELQQWKSQWLNTRAGWNTGSGRLWLEVGSSLILTAVVVFAAYTFLYRVIWGMDIFMPSYYLYVILVFFISLSFMALVNAGPLINEWRRSVVKAETLEKETLNAKLEALQTQLSPHFMFNNFSILNGLIDENPAQARQFVDKLSDVYRYILSHKNDEVVPLAEELAFIEDYRFLLEMRFQNKFTIEVDIDHHDYWIPPVTLQQLVENAIKHNEASYRHPLAIRIRQSKRAGAWLQVENTVQPRQHAAPSTGIGLQNIMERFDLLTDQKADFRQEEQRFIVRIPLISVA